MNEIPSNVYSWFWTILHMIIITLLFALPFITHFFLPKHLYWLMPFVFAFLFLHWYILKECIISLLEKKAENKDYKATSLPCFTYVISVPAYVFGIDYYTMRDIIICLNHVALITLIMMATTSELSFKNILVFYIVVTITLLHLQRCDRRNCM